MSPPDRSYRYVGPVELRALVRPGGEGRVIGSPADFAEWIARRSAAELGEPFTFVVGLDGLLRLADRRSEHVVCAGGGPVLSAGEIGFEGPAADGGWSVGEVTNQSTGYCPEADSWPAVGAALDRLALRHPGRFTCEFVFRRCVPCGQHGIVREGDFHCALCAGELSRHWNVDPAAVRAQLTPEP